MTLMTSEEIERRLNLVKKCLKVEKDRAIFQDETIFLKVKSRSDSNEQVRIKNVIVNSKIEYDNDSIVNIPYEDKTILKFISATTSGTYLPIHIKKHLFTVQTSNDDSNNSKILNIIKPNGLDVSAVVQLSGEELKIYYAIPHTISNGIVDSFFYSKTMDFENDELFLFGLRTRLGNSGAFKDINHLKDNMTECLSYLKLLTY